MIESIRLLKKLSSSWTVNLAQNAAQTTLNTLTVGTTAIFGQIFRAINVVTSCESTFKTIISYQVFYKNREEATEFVVLKNREVFSILLWETDRNIKWHIISE